MNITIINRAILAMCQELMEKETPIRKWHSMTEEELLYEAAVCIFGSQSKFEVAVAMADRLRDKDLLQPVSCIKNRAKVEQDFIFALSDPLPISVCDGIQRWARPRFKNRHASMLVATINEIYGKSLTIRGLLCSTCHARKAREILNQHVCGFGPKQASLFLRRVCYSDDLAVLDIHVLDYLKLASGLALPPNKLGMLSFYEKIEEIFRDIAIKFGHSVGCVDLATWITMRVAKREAFYEFC